jgi:hypothetical protein
MKSATASSKSQPALGVQATCLRLHAKASDAANIAPRIELLTPRRERPDHAVVEVAAAAVNPSDGRDWDDALCDLPPHAWS